MIGKNIRYLRKQRGMSQDKLAELLGKKSISTIQYYETERSLPTVGVTQKICDIFNVTIEDLINVDLSKESPTFYGKSQVSKILMYHDRLNALSEADREIIYNMIDALSKKGE